MDIFYSIVKFFVQGGAFMYPILLVAAVGTAIAVERYITLTRLGVKNRSAWARIQPALLKGEFDKARADLRDEVRRQVAHLTVGSSPRSRASQASLEPVRPRDSVRS